MKNVPRWKELCQEIADEQDPRRFDELVKELLQLLNDKKVRLEHTPEKP